MATTYVRAGGSVLDAAQVIGCRVQNPQGENLGKIETLVFDLSEGRIFYAVLSFGGFLGFGDKLFPIPLTSLSFRSGKDGDLERCILNVDKDTLNNAPGFDRGEMSAHLDRKFLSRVYFHYGVTPYWGN
jgi:hypothetical protein